MKVPTLGNWLTVAIVILGRLAVCETLVGMVWIGTYLTARFWLALAVPVGLVVVVLVAACLVVAAQMPTTPVPPARTSPPLSRSVSASPDVWPPTTSAVLPPNEHLPIPPCRSVHYHDKTYSGFHFFCSLANGHAGPHVARGVDGELLDSWQEQ